MSHRRWINDERENHYDRVRQKEYRSKDRYDPICSDEPKYAEFHVLGDHVYKTRMTLAEIEKLGDGFLKIHRGCLVSAMAVHDIKDRVDLSNGEALEYTVRKKKIILKELQSIQEKMIHEFRSENIPKTKEEFVKKNVDTEKVPDTEKIPDTEKEK